MIFTRLLDAGWNELRTKVTAYAERKLQQAEKYRDSEEIKLWTSVLREIGNQRANGEHRLQ